MECSVTMATDQETPQNTRETEGSSSSSDNTQPTMLVMYYNIVLINAPHSEGPYGATLLADVYDDMATVNSRLATLQSKWAGIVRSDVQLEVLTSLLKDHVILLL